MALATKIYTVTGQAQTFHGYNSEPAWTVLKAVLEVSGESRKHALSKALRKLQATFPNHKEYEVTITDVRDNPDTLCDRLAALSPDDQRRYRYAREHGTNVAQALSYATDNNAPTWDEFKLSLIDRN